MKLRHRTRGTHWGHTTGRYYVVEKFHRYDYNRVLYWFKCISFFTYSSRIHLHLILWSQFFTHLVFASPNPSTFPPPTTQLHIFLTKWTTGSSHAIRYSFSLRSCLVFVHPHTGSPQYSPLYYFFAPILWVPSVRWNSIRHKTFYKF